MKEGRCEAAGGWSNRVRSVTRALTTDCMKRGTAPGNGVKDLTQKNPDKLNTIKWEKYVLRHTQKTNEKEREKIIRIIKKAQREIEKGKAREKMGKVTRKIKRKIERKRKITKWSALAGENKLKIATINPDNMIDEGIIDEIIDKMERYNIDIAAIQETHDKKRMIENIEIIE